MTSNMAQTSCQSAGGTLAETLDREAQTSLIQIAGKKYFETSTIHFNS